MGSSQRVKKKSAVRNLKPISSTTRAGQLPKAKQNHVSDVIESGSLAHKQRPAGQDQGMVIDMGMGPGIVVNHKKKQRKEMMKDIDMDVN